MSFWDGLAIGIMVTLVIVGIACHVFGNGSPLVGRIPRWKQGAATKVSQRSLNGVGLACAVVQTLLTLLVTELFAQGPNNQRALVLAIAWFTASLLLAVLLTLFGTRTATVVWKHEVSDPDDL